jgi:rhodanese-related sulfurtransferase
MDLTPPAPRSIDELLAEARSGLRRLEPAEAQDAGEHGALLVDMRPSEQRDRDGAIPGALIVDRNVLEWRLDPQSPHRLSCITGHEQHIILICNQGFSSSLAAATLQRLGLRNATDVVGGVQKWRDQGLPLTKHAGQTGQL